MDERLGSASTATGVLATVSTATGVFAPVTVLLTVAVGAVTSPTYDWPTDPFSVLGVPGEPTADWFGAGLLVAGLLGLPFAARLWRTRGLPVGGLYALVCLSFAGAGLVPLGSVWHEVFGAGILLAIPVLLWVAGVADLRDSSRRDGALAVLLGTAALAVWLPYDLGVERAQLGYGFAELVAFLALAVWSSRTAVRLWRVEDGRTTGEPTPEEVAR